MADDKLPVIAENREIQSMIFTFRGKQVMVDRDLAELYHVETRVLNQAVKRNIDRFPVEFRFQLDDEEKQNWSKLDRFETLKHSTSSPYVLQSKE